MNLFKHSRDQHAANDVSSAYAIGFNVYTHPAIKADGQTLFHLLNCHMKQHEDE